MGKIRDFFSVIQNAISPSERLESTISWQAQKIQALWGALQEMKMQKKEILKILYEASGTYEAFSEFRAPDAFDKIQMSDKIQRRGLDIAIQDFDVYQMRAIANSIDAGLSNKQILIFAKPELHVWHMEVLRDAMEGGLPIEQAAKYAAPNFSCSTIDGLRKTCDALREVCVPYPEALKKLNFFYEWMDQDENIDYETEQETAQDVLTAEQLNSDGQAALGAEPLPAQAAGEQIVGYCSWPSREERIAFTDPQEYVAVVKEELDNYMQTGFRYETVTQDPAVHKAVDDAVYDLFGEENPHDLDYYANRHVPDAVAAHYQSFVGMSLSNPAATLHFMDYDASTNMMTVYYQSGSNDYIEDRGTPKEIAEDYGFSDDFKRDFFDPSYRNEVHDSPYYRGAENIGTGQPAPEPEPVPEEIPEMEM